MKRRDMQQILILRLSSIGDILLTTPLIRAVRERFPDARIDFVTKQEFAELILTNPHLNTVYQYDSRSGTRGLVRLGRQLRKNRYDLWIDVHKNLRTYILRTLGQPRQTAAYAKQMLRRTLLVKTGVNLYREIHPIPDRYLKAVEAFGVINTHHGLEVFPTEQQYANVDRLLRQEHVRPDDLVIGFGPIAAHPLKQWPLENFVTLGRQLIQHCEARILLFGGPGDRDLGETIAKELGPAAIDLCGKLSLLESAAALTHCEVFVGNDTGTVHMAAAMQRKVVVLFGPTVEEFGFYPYQTPATVLCRPLTCRPCTHTGKGTCKIRDTHACLRKIPVSEVREAVEAFLPQTDLRSAI